MKPVSALDPACRLLCLALLSSAALLASPWVALFLALALFALLALEGQRPSRILRESAFLALFILFAGVLECVDIGSGPSLKFSAPVETPALGARLLAGYLGGRLYYATTGVPQTRDAATRIARRLPGLSRLDLGFAFSLILGFIPLIIDEWKLSLEAAKARAYGRHRGWSGAGLLVTAYLRRLMLRAIAVPEALVARGWSGERRVEPVRWGFAEAAASFACVGFLILSALRIV